MGKKINAVIMNMIILLFAVLLLSVILEIGLRIFSKNVPAKEESESIAEQEKKLIPRYIYEEDNNTGYKFKPKLRTTFRNTKLRTNSAGLRSRDFGEKGDNVFRIVVLGDSSTFGWDVEEKECYVKQLESMLNAWGKKRGRKFEVINCGIPGYGTDQELALLKSVALSYSPDLVLIGFYSGNDITDNMIGGIKRRSVRNGYLVDDYLHEEISVDEPVFKGLMDFLAQKSVLFPIARDGFSKLLLKLGFGDTADPYYGLEVKQLDVFKKDYSPETEEGFRKTESLIEEISRVSETAGAKTAIILIPPFYQVYPAAWEKYLSSYGLDSSKYDYDKPDDKLKVFCKKKGINVIDLRDKLRSFERGINLYLFEHWNARGHSMAAFGIYEYLMSSILRETTPVKKTDKRYEEE